MHFCRATIAIGGDTGNVFNAGDYSPISWPEALLLQFIHGDDAVNEVQPFARVAQSSRDERARLISKYGEKPVIEVFARQNIAEMEAPGVKIVKGIHWFNPVTQSEEVTGEEPAVEAVEAEPEVESGGETVVYEDEAMERPARKRAR